MGTTAAFPKESHPTKAPGSGVEPKFVLRCGNSWRLVFSFGSAAGFRGDGIINSSNARLDGQAGGIDREIAARGGGMPVGWYFSDEGPW